MEAETIDDFLVELDNHDAHFRGLIEEAHAKNAKLRYVASLKEGKASINLEMVTQESPFYNLASTDNMIVFHTARYKERPLVIQGPGAGADVTAAGVFAEIIQLGNAVAYYFPANLTETHPFFLVFCVIGAVINAFS